MPPSVVQPVTGIATPVVNTLATALAGYTTYQLFASLDAAVALNLYSVFGTATADLIVPAAYQEATPFGANVGGVNPAFFSVSAGAEFDSWLSVGLSDGDPNGAISSIGIDFAAWTASAPLDVADGAVFWMAPHSAPGGNVIVAQLSLNAGTTGDVTMGLQGRSVVVAGQATMDWQSTLQCVDVANGCGTGGGGATPAPAPADCAGTAGGTVVNDACGVCAGDGSTCAGCDSVPNSGAVNDACGICGGDGSTCAPAPPAGGGGMTVTPSVVAVTTASATDTTIGGVAQTTYTLSADLTAADTTGTASNLYTIYGTADSHMSVPAGYQCATPFGSNTGGTNAAFWAIANSDALGYSAQDSWLTAGVIDGDAAGALSSIGIEWTDWTATARLEVPDGAVFWMSPDGAPGGVVVVAQITVPAGATVADFTAGAQGRSAGGADDWTQDNIHWTIA